MLAMSASLLQLLLHPHRCFVVVVVVVVVDTIVVTGSEDGKLHPVLSF